MSAGGSTQTTSSDSSSNSQMTNNSFNASRSYVDPTQGGYLGDLYGQAQSYANPAATQAAAYSATQANAGGLNQAYNAAVGMTDPAAQIAAQEASLASGLGNMFRNELNPAIESNAIAAGGFGGGRQGVAQGVAAGELANAYTSGLGDITARANQSAMAAQSLVPQLAQARYASQVMPTMAGLDALGQYGGILGGPTVLNQGWGGSAAQSTSATNSQSRGNRQQMQFGIANPFG